jgi:CRP-like cAMP-binding protein
MESSGLTTFLTSNLDIKNEYLEELLQGCNIRDVKSGSYLLRKGAQNNYSFFVEKGLLTKYGIDEKGKEIILQFAPENWFITDRESTCFRNPSQYFIQALEDSRVFLLDENFIQDLGKKVPGFAAFNTRLLHNHIRHQTKRIYELLSSSAEERYLSFIHTYPDITLRVPQWMIASYLGITPESLSRVRKELAQRNSKSNK